MSKSNASGGDGVWKAERRFRENWKREDPAFLRPRAVLGRGSRRITHAKVARAAVQRQGPGRRQAGARTLPGPGACARLRPPHARWRAARIKTSPIGRKPHARVQHESPDAAPRAQDGRRRHLRRLRGRSRQGVRPGHQDRHPGDRCRRRPGQDRGVRHADLRGASCDGQWRADSAGDLGDLGRS